MALLKRGVDDATIKGRVQSERTDWHNHKGETRAEHYLAETLKKAKAFVGSSGYTVDIFDKEKKTKLKTVVVENIPSGKGHEAYLAQRARDIVVKEGYEPKTITVDVQRFRIQDADKSKGFSMSKEMTK